ncbi:putative Ig domain-containing protein [Spirosoma endophyticum]|uniref:Immunoglobulin I-set domain-containing protein n=1 Tax=Spirosoma endophyticum TaxID=662367 RepID=A0A1I2E7Q5_9BACT|nr:putative Ig domain-containing protein [Spirosoma endophyticum]SFE88518.1 Immunoglobulin I-set domain-containing protein [Spirosoma endophyticum]
MKTLFYLVSQALKSLLVLVLLSALGRPTQAQNSGSVTTTQSFSYTGQIVSWTVPTGVTSLTIEARGAEGGFGDRQFGGDFIIYPAGKGALIRGTVAVSGGQTLKILVGQKSPNRNGGGGGSFITTNTNAPLIIAGGGGGSGTDSDLATKDGQSSRPGGANGGNDGNGGPAIAGASAGGGGLLTDGSNSNFPNGPNEQSRGGKAFVNGGAGSSNNDSFGLGGFGGGGSGTGTAAGGGGGGYSGGGGNKGPGGGGGSFNGGTNQTNTVGANSGNGLVNITYTTPPQPIRYVKQGGTGDGTSWTNASGDLQAMINADQVQQVWVAGGAYYPGTSRGSSFSLKSGVAVYGGFNSTNPESSTASRSSINPVLGTPSSTTLSGDIGTKGVNTDNSYIILTNNNVASTARLDGFVISGAYNANNNFFDISGAGVVNSGGGPSFVNCQISQNTITPNTLAAGAGMTNLQSNPTLLTCVISGNMANGTSGGGIYNNTCSPTITSCIIASNTATGGGGGMYNVDSNSGATSPVLTNCLLIQNVGGSQGGASYDDRSSPRYLNCTFAGNRANSGAAIQNGGSPSLTNCIIWDNQGSAALGGSTVTANYCLVESAEIDYSGTGNIKATSSPFTMGSYLLSGCSVALNAGNNAAYTSTQGPGTDLAGNSRFYQGGVIDIGAYEYQGNPTPYAAITSRPPSASSVTVGAIVSVPVSVTGSVSQYQWYKDNLNTPVGGQTTATLNLINVQPSDAGSYSVVVTGSCNSVTSTAFSLSVSAPTQPIRYVRQGGSGTGDGTSWANASGDLQSQVNIAGAQQVWVAGGTYQPASGGSFAMKNGVAIYGGFSRTSTASRPSVNPVPGPGGASQPSSTTLLGNGNSVIRNPQGLTSGAVLDGFVIQGGRVTDGSGGGMYNYNSSPRLTNLVFINNSAAAGGGIYNEFGSKPSLTNCVFSANSATSGGGLFNLTGSQAELIDCVISSNLAVSGAGIYNAFQAGCRLDNCKLVGNVATQDGGGIYTITNGSLVTLSSCTLSGNAAVNGGGVYNDSGVPTLINCLIEDNKATGQGGGIYFTQMANYGSLTNCLLRGNSAQQGGAMYNRLASPTLTNCTISDNTASQGGALYNTYFSPTLTSSIVWHNHAGTGVENTFVNTDGSTILTRYCLIESGVTSYSAGEGTIMAVSSPFASDTDYRLAMASQAIDAGDPSSTTATSGATDLENNPRIANTRIDIGAYEYQGPFCQPVVITQQPTSGLSVCVGSSVTAMISVSGTSPTYQWYKDGTSLGSAQQSATLTLTHVQPSQAGAYMAVVTGSCNSVTSTAFSLTVNSLPAATLTASPSTVLSCAQTSLTLTAGGGTSFAFSGPAIASQANNQAVVNAPGTYSVTVTNAGCTSTTAIAISQDTTVPVATLMSSGPLSCAVTSVTLTASGGTSYSFANGSGPLGTPGPTNMLVVSSAGTYSVTVANASGCVSSTSTTVTSNTATVSVTNPATTNATQGTSFNQTFTASGGIAPRSFSLASGSLPAGLSLSTAGVLSGTPTQSGSFSLTVQATDANGCSGVSASYSLTVLGGQLTVIAPDYNCASGVISFHTTGGDGSPIEYFATGITPWTSNPTQRIETELRADPKKIQLLARQNGLTVSYLFDLPAYCAGLPTPPQSSTNPAPIVSQGIGAQVAVEREPYRFTIPAGTFTDPQGEPLTYYALALPAGLSLQGNEISGTPTTQGRAVVTLIAVDPSGQTANTSFWFTVGSPVSDVTPVLTTLPALQYGRTPFSLVVDVFELNGVGTGGAVTLYLAKDPQVVLSFDGASMVIGGKPVQNRNWSFDGTSNNDFYILTCGGGVSGGGKQSVGLNGISTPGSTRGRLTLSATVSLGNRAELRLTNNTDADQVEYFNK